MNSALLAHQLSLREQITPPETFHQTHTEIESETPSHLYLRDELIYNQRRAGSTVSHAGHDNLNIVTSVRRGPQHGSTDGWEEALGILPPHI